MMLDEPSGTEVICDTNIWRSIAMGETKVLDFHHLIATFNTIDELHRTRAVVTYSEHIAKTLQIILRLPSNQIIYTPPFHYLCCLANPSYEFDYEENIGPLLRFTEAIAAERELTDEFKNAFMKYSEGRKQDLNESAKLLNAIAREVKVRIQNLEKHRKEDTIPGNRNFIRQTISTLTQCKDIPSSFNWKEIELFERVLGVVFMELETGASLINENDWYDLSILLYVNPNRKYWTKDKKWISYILKAGCENYLI